MTNYFQRGKIASAAQDVADAITDALRPESSDQERAQDVAALGDVFYGLLGTTETGQRFLGAVAHRVNTSDNIL